MNFPTINELQPYFSALAAILSFATLGFLINLIKVTRDAAKDRAELLEERIKSLQDDLDRTEKWSEREKEALSIENEKLKQQLQETLDETGVTLGEIGSGLPDSNIQNSLLQKVRELVEKMELSELSGGRIKNPDWNLEMARGYMATNEWVKAAEHFDNYVVFDPNNFDVQIARGVAHANTRQGRGSDLMALIAYSYAVSLAPVDLSENMLARLYAYRGAMLKRLNRLDEAEAELIFAKKFAQKYYEQCDIRYNLAGVYALKGDREKLLSVLREMELCRAQLNAILYHLNDYFSTFKNDDEFLKLIS